MKKIAVIFFICGFVAANVVGILDYRNGWFDGVSFQKTQNNPYDLLLPAQINASDVIVQINQSKIIYMENENEKNSKVIPNRT